jgi:hypothetical protein
VNGLIDDVQENDTVTFELERGQKGLNAVRVKIYKEKPAVEKPAEEGKDETASEEE